MKTMSKRMVLALLVAGALGAETMVEHSSEARFQLDLKVPDAALMAMLPRVSR